MRGLLFSAMFMLAATGASAQIIFEPQDVPKNIKEVTTPRSISLTEEDRACLGKFFPSDFGVKTKENGYEVRNPEFGLMFAKDLSCTSGKLNLSDVVIIGEPIQSNQKIGSAFKADGLTVWAPRRRESCDVPVDYGFEIRNLRWFDWNDSASDGGNKRFEVIRTGKGQELRISTMSHMRASKATWSPTPETANSPCALAGSYHIENMDVRWSKAGTAYGALIGTLRGDMSLSVTPEDAKQAFKKPFLTFTGSNVSLTDITENVTARMSSTSGKIEISQESALPWAFFIKKYARDLIYRQPDDSLLLRILPIDLANTFYFTKGTGRLSVPNATVSPAAFLPSSVGYDLGRVNLSTVFMSFESAVALNGKETGQIGINAQATGIGKVESEIDFRTQMFGREYLKAASDGTLSLQGKTGPGIVGWTVKFEDMGFVDVFMSIMKSKPSTYIMKANKANMTFWQQVSVWIASFEQGNPSSLAVTLSKPQLMLDDFWTQAPEGARAHITESKK